MFNVIIRETDEIRIAFVRRFYGSKADALREAADIAEKLPKAIIGRRKIIINYETEYKESDFDLAACAEITGSLPKNSACSEKTLTFGNNVASLCCKENELDEAYKAIIRHLESSDYKICGAYYEIYHDDGTVELKVSVSGKAKEPLYSDKNQMRPLRTTPKYAESGKLLTLCRRASSLSMESRNAVTRLGSTSCILSTAEKVTGQ